MIKMAVWDNWSGPTQQRDIFLPVTGLNEALQNMVFREAHPAVRVNGAGDRANIEFRVPWDYDSIINAELIFVGGPGGNGNAMPGILTVNFARANVGETYGLFRNADLSRNLGGINEENVYGEDISDLLAGIRAGDQVGVRLEYNGGWAPQTDVYVLGIRFRYRADPFDSNASP